MQPIEQVFLQVHLRSSHWTAQFMAATNAVQHADLNEITDWFTGAEQELTLRCDPFNLFFHPLPSGHYALGLIYSQPFNVQILIVPPKSLLDYANHPIALFESVLPQIPFVSQPPSQLSPLVLPAFRGKPIDASEMESLLKQPGAMAIAQLTQSLFNAESTLFTSRSVSALPVLSALFDLLPIPYRPELTFSSDFFLSAKNSFRLSGFNRLHKRTILLMKQWGVPVISLERSNKGSEETLDPWARFIYQLLRTRNFEFWNQHGDNETVPLLPLGTQPIYWDNLNEVGVALSKAMLSGTPPEKHVSATEFSAHTLEELRCAAAVDQMIPMLPGLKLNGAKRVSEQRLGDRFPQFREELSELEAYLVRGIFGDESVLPSIKRVWSQLLPQLDGEMRDSIQEAMIVTIHAVLTSLECDTGQRLLRSSQLLELMMCFLNRNGGTPGKTYSPEG